MNDGRKSLKPIHPNLIWISLEISTFMVHLSIFNWFKIRFFWKEVYKHLAWDIFIDQLFKIDFLFYASAVFLDIFNSPT